MTAVAAVNVTGCLKGNTRGADFELPVVLVAELNLSPNTTFTSGRELFAVLTLNCEQGYVNRWTFPKSSPVTRRLLSLVLPTALMSVPSDPSGHKPEEKRRGDRHRLNAGKTSSKHERMARTHTPVDKKSSLTKHLKAQRAGVGVPLNVSGGLHADHLLAHRRDP